MNMFDVFKTGVTPKTKFTIEKRTFSNGERFRVITMTKDTTQISLWDSPDEEFVVQTDEIEPWKEPVTALDDQRIILTWGTLKQAMENAKISDDTRFVVDKGLRYERACIDLRKYGKEQIVLVY